MVMTNDDKCWLTTAAATDVSTATSKHSPAVKWFLQCIVNSIYHDCCLATRASNSFILARSCYNTGNQSTDVCRMKWRIIRDRFLKKKCGYGRREDRGGGAWGGGWISNRWILVQTGCFLRSSPKAGLNAVLVKRRPKCQTLSICMPVNDRLLLLLGLCNCCYLCSRGSCLPSLIECLLFCYCALLIDIVVCCLLL